MGTDGHGGIDKHLGQYTDGYGWVRTGTDGWTNTLDSIRMGTDGHGGMDKHLGQYTDGYGWVRTGTDEWTNT